MEEVRGSPCPGTGACPRWPILSKDGRWWQCSWRHSGGIVSNLREQGDYIDWYCSGIMADEERPIRNGYLMEGTVDGISSPDSRDLGRSLSIVSGIPLE